MPSLFVKPSLIKIVFGTAVVSLTLGAVQFASGHDLSLPLLSGKPGEAVINRADKADRASVASPVMPTRTIAFRPGDLPGTSVLVRIPLIKVARETTRSRPLIQSGQTQSKPMVACEPVVSVLTEVAHKLQPGRCVT
ncbi:hypothetical protein [Bradyrhizobium sp. Tv2a-2]|uniref:hypothetical protein n=1 Tax=Bradyrhizobium sp. Tv2a-2 TaxID=113395 RepID=UPI00040B2C1A|nr:hypothetical protein [Bradyrhizobium sp. Tv2a-2]